MLNRSIDRSFAIPVVLMASFAAAQQPTAPPPTPAYVGEVTGNEVNVRSGPSTNYYIVAKLPGGTRLRVFEENNGWLKIAPPAPCFSVMHQDFIDLTPDSDEGVVNGDNVLVRAGSELSEHLYAKQLKLNRGAVVKVLKPHNDDYLRIAPPEGAFVYISADYVAEVPASRLAAQPSASESAADPAAFTGKTDDSESPASAAVDVPDALKGAHREELSAIDDLLQAEESKPLLHRDYGPIIARYRELAQQESDTFARAYAETRLSQIQNADETVTMVREVRELGQQLATDRTAAMQARQRIVPPLPAIGGGFDAVGELRESMIYRSPLGPRRYRLVDDDGLRTIAYVEIPRNSPIDVKRFIGRKIGVRASETHLQTEDVDPLVIYVASELVQLDTGMSQAHPPNSAVPGGEN